MSEYKSSIEKWRPSGFVRGMWFGIAIMFTSNILVEAMRDDDVNPTELQANNHHLQEELAGDFNDVDGLILDSSNKSFTFETQNGDVLEVCTGQYEISQEIATVAGNIACTRTLQPQGNK